MAAAALTGVGTGEGDELGGLIRNQRLGSFYSRYLEAINGDCLITSIEEDFESLVTS